MIRMLLLHLLLSVVYLIFSQSVTPLNILLAFILGFLVTQLVARCREKGSYAGAWLRTIRFFAYFIWILLKANVQVTKEILTKTHHMQPRFVRYPVDGLTDAQLTVLANAITLTPGTLAVDISDDKEVLYVHCMYAADADQAIAELDTLRHRLLTDLFNA
jgi:multicomponent Na+:H+ antiporter subunit E